MNNCQVCASGTLREELVETCLRRGDRWILFRNVPALVCGVCGEKSFSQEVAERLARIIDPANREFPTSYDSVPVYDLVEMNLATSRKKRLPRVSKTDTLVYVSKTDIPPSEPPWLVPTIEPTVTSTRPPGRVHHELPTPVPTIVPSEDSTAVPGLTIHT